MESSSVGALTQRGRIDLHQHWQSLINSVEVIDSDDRVYNKVIEAYREKHRVYHTLTHLEHFIFELQPLDSISNETWFAVYYHDFIYNPGSSSNERKSAEYAKSVLEKWHLSDAFIQRVMMLINATKSHRVAPEDVGACLFLDADMAILGSPLEDYLQYADAIRQEHKQYPDLLYKSGRTKFLNQTLTNDRLFLSDHFYQKYEQQARLNIQTELYHLGQ